MSVAPSRKFYKELSTSNPILSNMFCADPCGIEFEDFHTADRTFTAGKVVERMIITVLIQRGFDRFHVACAGIVNVPNVALSE